jgi:4'-phosphopantetheinyl transferase EntD
MTSIHDSSLQQAIEGIALPGILVGHRVIAAGDETALLPDEVAAFAGSVIKVRRASGAARIIARELLTKFGHAPGAIPKLASGAPTWPNGFVGSLAHDATVAVAAVALRQNYASIGVDIEPAAALDIDLLSIVATARERERVLADPLQGRLLFAVKEAVYKAVYPLEGLFLEHHDVETSLASGTATIRNGRVVPFRYCVTPRIAVLAYISAPAA